MKKWLSLRRFLHVTSHFFSSPMPTQRRHEHPHLFCVINTGFENVWRAEKMARLVMMSPGNGPFFHLATTYVCATLLSSYTPPQAVRERHLSNHIILLKRLSKARDRESIHLSRGSSNTKIKRGI
jgi:hypothetical protein